MVDVLADLRLHPTDAISDEGQVLQDCEQGFLGKCSTETVSPGEMIGQEK